MDYRYQAVIFVSTTFKFLGLVVLIFLGGFALLYTEITIPNIITLPLPVYVRLIFFFGAFLLFVFLVAMGELLELLVDIKSDLSVIRSITASNRQHDD